MNGATAIIPCFNEATRILPVLDVIMAMSFDAVIVSDDGSTDRTVDVVGLRYGPTITLLRSPQNEGKATAIRRVLPFVHSSIVMLIDADVKSPEARSIECAIRALQSQPTLGMVLLRRRAISFLNFETAFTGERAIRTQHLVAALTMKPEKYQIEAAMNMAVLRSGQQVAWLQSDMQNVHKTKKNGLLVGLVKEIDMYAQISSFCGFWLLTFMGLGTPAAHIGGPAIGHLVRRRHRS